MSEGVYIALNILSDIWQTEHLLFWSWIAPMFHGAHASIWNNIFRRFRINSSRLNKAESRLTIAEQGLKSECEYNKLYNML